MDSDGYVSKNGQCEYTSTNETLANNILELLNSLDLKVLWVLVGQCYMVRLRTKV